MALAKQFYSSFKSYNGWDYYLEIWVEGYSGSASEITLGAGGPVITYGTDEQDRFSSILSSKLELPFMVTNTTEDAFIKNIREQFNEQDVYIHLYRESSSGYSSVAPLWSGFVLMDLSASPDLYYPYPVTLTAVDGLSLLKEIDFVQSGTAGSYTDSDMYSSNGRFTYWIKEILLKSGASTTAEGSTQDYKFTTAINWFNSVMPTITQSTDPFYQTKCNTQMFFSKDANDNFTVVNCYDVLKNLLKHWGARIIYWKHIYYIVQIQEYNTAESGTYANPDNIDTRTYTKTGAFDGSSDNLGDSYWTRYNLLIDDVTGGIQKLTGTQFNYLPQLKRTQANFIDYGNKNYFGGLPFDLTTGQTDVIKQATLVDVSTDGTMILIIPLDVTMVTQYQGVLNMLLYFRLYITDGVTTYYLRYDPSNTPKYYWEDSSSINLNTKRTFWKSDLDNIVGTQTKVGFHQQIDFVDVNGSALTLNGEWDVFTDIDNWGSNNGSFIFKYAITGPFTYTPVYTPSATTIYWTNTLDSAYQNPLNLSIIGTTTQPSAYNPSNSLNPTTQNNIVTYTTSLNQNPFEGKLLIVNTSSSGALYGSFVSVSPSPTTNDSQIVDFGELIWGDTLLASSEGSLKVWNGSSFVKSNVIGTWGLGSTSGTNSFTEMLLSEYLYGQTKVIESPSMRLVIGETNKNQNDGSGLRPNYVNPIGRLKGYSATGTTPYYIFKSGSFHLLKDEIDYQGYQIIRDTQTLTKTDDVIIGPDILQDKTNIIGQKTPQTNSLINKVTQNSFITTTSALKSAYGNDIAVNGIFASDTGWTKGTGWSIASNKASFSPTGSTSDIKQDTLTNALTYKIVVSLTLSAGALSVKAGSSGNATVLSSSGTYEIFSTCAGSTEVIFEASAAFEGYIEKVVVQQQVPVTSISINAIGEAVFKTNDVLNIADVDGSDVNQFTVSSDQGASDTSISVTSKLITEDILEGSIILVNQNDLAAQYQNKTKGTVGGFDITANSIDSGSVSIESYIDDDTFATASATSLATSESIKAYVDTQVGSADTLAEVLANGNTTGGTDIVVSGNDDIVLNSLATTYSKLIGSDNTSKYFALENGSGYGIWSSYQGFVFRTAVGNTERMRLTTTGLGIGTTSPSEKLEVTDGFILASGSGTSHGFELQRTGLDTFQIRHLDGNFTINNLTDNRKDFVIDGSGNVGINTSSPSEKLHVVGDALITGDSHADAFKPAVSGNPIKFKNFDSSTEFARITDGGNVLIGVTSGSTARLQSIAADGNSSSLRIGRADNSNFWEFNHAGNDLRIYNEATSGSNILLGVDAGGNAEANNVGIKTDNPTSPLQVDGTIFINGSTLKVTRQSVTNYYDSNAMNSYGTLYDWEFSGSNVMRINSSGNLLLGTTSDSGSRLQVVKASDVKIEAKATTAGAFFKANSVGNGYFGMELFNDSTAKWFVGTYADHSSISANDFAIVSGSKVNGNLRFKIDSSGDATFTGQVTIPATPVASTDAASKGYVDAQIGANNDLQEVTDNGATTTNSITFAGGTSTGDITGQSITLGDGSTDEKLRVYYSDNSYVDLHGYGLWFSRSHSYIRPVTNNDTVFHIGSATSNFSGVFNRATTHYWYNGATEKMRLSSSGGLSIGTSSGGYKLLVSGTGWGGTGIGIQSTTTNGAVLTLANTTRTFQLASRGNGFDIRDITDSDTSRLNISASGVATFYSQINTGYGVKFTNGDTDFLLYNNSGEDVLYMRDTTNGAMITTWGVDNFTVNKKLLVIDDTASSTAQKFHVGRATNAGLTITDDDATVYIKSIQDENLSGYGNLTLMADDQNNKDGYISFNGISGGERARITSTGRLAIGGTNPLATLHVFGSAAIDSYIYMGTGQRISWGNGNQEISATNDAQIDFKTGGSEKMRLLSNGNLLLGTTSDSGDRLRVVDDNPIVQISDSNSTIRYAAINFNTLGGNWFLSTGDSNTGAGVANSDLWITRNKTGSDNRFRFHRDHKAFSIYSGSDQNIYLNAGGNSYIKGGNLGIGTTSPSANLEIKSTGDTNVIIRTDGDASDVPSLELRRGTTSAYSKIHYEADGGSNAGLHLTDFRGDANSHIIFNTQGDNERMRIESNGNILVNTTTDSGAKLYVNGVIRAVGGGIQAAQDYGFTLNDESGSNRYGLKFGAAGTVGGSNLLMLTNRSFNSATGGGEVAIGGNTNTSGVSEVEIARFKPRVAATSGTQKKVSLDAVLELTEQTAPANPASGESIIWMDSSSGDLKVKINYGGTTVTRTLASFE